MMTPTISIPLSEGISIPLIRIPGGEFLMGDDKSEKPGDRPAHRVRLDDFYLGQFPVTQALWKAVMNGKNPSFFQGDDRPVEQVSWDDITDRFLPTLHEHLKASAPAWHFRLPTEAEWEYAVRGGPHWEDGFRYSGGNKLKEIGWFKRNSHGETKPVGLKPPNALGLYDMSGNIREWCQDWYAENYYKKCFKKDLVENPQGPRRHLRRAVRGGSFSYRGRGCRVAYRDSVGPAYAHRFGGFRLAASFQAVDLTLPANR